MNKHAVEAPAECLSRLSGCVVFSRFNAESIPGEIPEEIVITSCASKISLIDRQFLTEPPSLGRSSCLQHISLQWGGTCWSPPGNLFSGTRQLEANWVRYEHHDDRFTWFCRPKRHKTGHRRNLVEGVGREHETQPPEFFDIG